MMANLSHGETETHSPKEIQTTRAEKTCWAMTNILTPAYMVTLVSQIDATVLESTREQYRLKGLAPPSYTALIIKAAALIMKRNPQANRAILGLPFFKRLYQFQTEDISVAVEKNLPAFPGNPYAAPIRNSLDKSLADISDELQALANCDESNNEGYRDYMRILKYVPRPWSLLLINAPYWFPKLWAQYRGCACWVNAPSKSGADLVMTTWPWPITFSFGFVKKRPIVVGNEVKVCLTMPIVMIFDRRIMGGGPAGRIFAQFKDILEGELIKERI
jgi:pyruvate/2-oxoglutarate dehydrogenase complex dihydrolipoamide acyltransferase (E2) component